MRLFGKKTDVEDLIYEAVSCLEKGQPKIAIPILNNALSEDPKNTTALYNKGLALNQTRKYNDAITCFDEVLEINPNDTQSLNNKAIALAELGNTTKQLKSLTNSYQNIKKMLMFFMQNLEAWQRLNSSMSL